MNVIENELKDSLAVESCEAVLWQDRTHGGRSCGHEADELRFSYMTGLRSFNDTLRFVFSGAEVLDRRVSSCNW